MKKKYQVLIYFILVILTLLVLYLSPWPQGLINLIVINVIIYILRKPLLTIFSFFVKQRFYRAIFSISINLIWSIFLFWLLFVISLELFIAIISFLIVAISLNFNKIINNMVSGALLFTSELFEIKDLIETNNIQGIVKEVNLNYTIIREFDGVEVKIPNSNVYNSTILKFTHNKFKIFELLSKEQFRKKKHYKEYIKFVNNILSAKIKTTIYVKNVELLGSINPPNLDDSLSEVFERYESIFGIKPDYIVGMTRFGRTRIKFRLKSKKPELILNFTDSFLRDVLFALYPEEIYDGWKSYKKNRNKKVNGDD